MNKDDKKFYFGTTSLALLAIITMPLGGGSFSIYPEAMQDESFMEMCNWVQKNTEKSDMFLTEPFSDVSSDFRLICFRSIYFSYGPDGPVALFSEEMAYEWDRRYKIVQNLYGNLDAREILKDENINYIISKGQLPLFYDTLRFHNWDYFVYEVV